MIRQTSAAVLLLSAMLVYASKSAGQSPLKIYCSSPTQDYCMSFLTWEATFTMWEGGFVETNDPFAAVAAYASWRTTVQLYGTGIQALAGAMSIIPDLNGPGGWEGHVVGPGRLLTSGHYRFTDSGAATLREPDGVDISTPADVRLINWGWAGGGIGTGEFISCRPGLDCVEVPEPGTYLLLLTGLFGLGFVAWRRRDETEHVA